MSTVKLPVYPDKILRVDLTAHEITEEVFDLKTMRDYVGGTGIGARILYDEVKPGVEWSDPANRLIIATGPLAGTRVAGSGTFSVVTKGCLTNGGTATQANGYLGAFLRFNGLMGVIFQGASDRWVYLYIHDGKAELRDAQHLVGKDTWETEDAIKQELGFTERQMSVFGIGPAGENLVKFAGIIGDKGHAAAHNGSGAVLGSKKLKAIAVARGQGSVKVYDKEKLDLLAKKMHESLMSTPAGRTYFNWGTSVNFPGMLALGSLPVKNMNTSLFPDHEAFYGENYRKSKSFEIKPNPCWACGSHHLHIMKVTEGPYSGYIGEEPEYECWSELGPLLMNRDVVGTFVLSNDVDRLGLDLNEAGWMIGFVMDCYDRGIITKKDTDGLEMTWGNVEAARTLLRNIAMREGFGNILAEGIKRAAEQIGGEALNHAVYIQKGHAPRGHDHRSRWTEIVDYATSGQGTIETGPASGIPSEFKLPEFTDSYSPDLVPLMVAKTKPKRQFTDCLGVCNFTLSSDFTLLMEMVNAATGWNLTIEDAINVSFREVNLFRIFNIRHGIGTEVEMPSKWYGSIPTDGPAKGRDIMAHFDYMLDAYYKHMGWDRKSGKPLPETLLKLGLVKEKNDIWQ
jgi:aldehyde:ferredoxin oxidoreductase